MTPIQNKLVDKLSRYFANVDEYNYKMICRSQIHDKNYEEMIQSMTVGRMMGGTPLAKYKYNNRYDYIESTKRNK